jgi:hypothetical protein
MDRPPQDRSSALREALRRSRIATAADLLNGLGISQPTLSRLLGRLRGDLARFGRGRRTRYALARSVRGFPSALPLYRIGASGNGERAS